MIFVVRTAKQDRQLKLAELHAAHAHIPTYVPAADDSDDARYADHFFVTNQPDNEHASVPTTVRVTCPTEDAGKRCAAILNDAAANGYWAEKRVWDKKKQEMVVVSREWALWSGEAPVPADVVRLIQVVLHPAWAERARPKKPAPPQAA